MQRASPERVRTLKAKGNEIASPEVAGAEWCGPRRTALLNRPPCRSLTSLTLNLPPDLARTASGSHSPTCDSGTCRCQFYPFQTLVSKV